MGYCNNSYFNNVVYFYMNYRKMCLNKNYLGECVCSDWETFSVKCDDVDNCPLGEKKILNILNSKGNSLYDNHKNMAKKIIALRNYGTIILKENDLIFIKNIVNVLKMSYYQKKYLNDIIKKIHIRHKIKI